MDKNIKVYNKDWNDNIFLDFSNNTIKREFNNDLGKFILIDNLLLIYWEKWNKEYFFTNNKKDYYQITDNNYFKLDNHISIIYIVDSLLSDKYIIDNNLQKIYNMNNLSYYGNIIKENNNLIINELIYIYINYKYYNKLLFDQLYEIVYIYNNIYLLEKNSNICYQTNNFYIKYKNILKIYNNDNNNNNKSNHYITIDKINYTEIHLKNNYKMYNEIDINDINNINNINNINECKILINKDNIYDIIHIIEYYIYFNIDYILFDNINNIEKNSIFDNLNIVYCNENELNDILCKKGNNEDYLIENININIKDLWYKLNENNLEKYNYLLKNYSNNNFEIPKIMHFIWLGDNKLPDEYINYIESWIKNHKDWIFCFWNDKNIPILINQKYYDETNVYAMKADILRYELLYIFGGVYIDCDFLCIKNIDNIIKNYKGFSGYESNEYIAIGLMGFIQYDIILLNIIKKLSYNIICNYDKSIPILSGPVFFTELWNKYKTDMHYSFPIEYFYSYTFQDKVNNSGYIINDNNYAIHMWGYSWSNKKYIKSSEYYLLYFYLSNIILDIDDNKIKFIENIKDKIYFKVNKINKKKIVHIMGLFFTGGIERYLYYIDKYGNHQLYNYYLLYISNNTYVYDIKNMNMISFNWDNQYLNNLLILINPDLIIDHYSIYLKENFYKNINKDIILYFIHSAICYNNDISYLLINKCINLYKESCKHISWNNIINNYYLTLGTELNINNKKNKKNKNNNNNNNIYYKKIKISIIGRIAEEKIGIIFLEKLSKISYDIFDNIEIHIYGEKDNIFNKNYVELFEQILINSKIIYHNFIDPLNMKDVYLNTNILLIPSFYETGSFTCIEAFSYGIPVIARNVYGLKYMIKNNITGYLCDNDDDIINKIINIKDDPIMNNIDIIKKESLKYNIIDKIKDLEYIISENIYDKNLVIITSVINCIDKPLSYYHKRSIFTIDERYKHTLKSIETIKKYIKNVDILFCECSDLLNYIDIEDDIKSKVNYYYNFYNNIEIRKNVESELKGLGEVSILLGGINKIKKNYKNIFKLSGRYFLNNNFDYEIYNNNLNIFTNWDNSKCSYCTVFYKINIDYIDYYKYILINSIKDLKNNNSIEICIYKYFKENIKVIDRVNVSGFLATEGYLYSI